MLRGSSDFDSVESYSRWLDNLVSRLNRRQQDKVNEERSALIPLPPVRGVDYDEVVVRVSSTCTIIAKRVTYTVPSRLIGESLRVRIYERHLELFLGNDKTFELQRTFTKGGNSRGRNIDFRHVIESLVKKPQAFRHSVLRDDLLPNDQFRAIWKRVDAEMEAHFACKFIVNVLYIAAKGDCVQALGDWLLEQDQMPPLHQIRQRFYPTPSSHDQVSGKQHDIIDYDALIKAGQS